MGHRSVAAWAQRNLIWVRMSLAATQLIPSANPNGTQPNQVLHSEPSKQARVKIYACLSLTLVGRFNASVHASSVGRSPDNAVPFGIRFFLLALDGLTQGGIA